MHDKFKFSLSGMWLFICLFTLIIPIFLPSAAGSANPATNVIGVATATMFILSFPCSLFGLPLLYFLGVSLGVAPNSMEGLYLNLFLMFVLGLVQWFWILPRVWKKEQKVDLFEIQTLLEASNVQPFQPADVFSAYDERKRSPVERVIHRENDEM